MAPDGFPMKKKSKPALVKQIRVVVADDHPIVREGLGALVSSQQDMKIVSEAANGRQAVQQLLLHRYPLVLPVQLPLRNAGIVRSGPPPRTRLRVASYH